MKVAITGSRGFIGSHLKTRLEKDGHEIIEWDLKQDPPKCIKDFDINEVDYVIHLAANVGGLFKNMSKNVEMFEDNLLMNLNVVKDPF